MNNTQVAALVRSLLMIGGTYFAAMSGDPTSAQGIVSIISAGIGTVWHHYAALTATSS